MNTETLRIFRYTWLNRNPQAQNTEVPPQHLTLKLDKSFCITALQYVVNGCYSSADLSICCQSKEHFEEHTHQYSVSSLRWDPYTSDPSMFEEWKQVVREQPSATGLVLSTCALTSLQLSTGSGECHYKHDLGPLFVSLFIFQLVIWLHLFGMGKWY